jgi:hypothetical protein
MHPALAKIIAKSALPDLLETLIAKLSLGDLTTLLLEVYRQKAAKLRPADLLNSLPQNRFVQPTDLDPIVLRQAELTAFELAKQAGFKCVELGPVTPFGSSSVYGKINQNNVLTGLRNCEVIADPSNLLCLLMSAQIDKDFDAQMDWFCSHRTLRTAFFEGAGRYAHFQMLAACSILKSQEIAPLLALVLKHVYFQKALFDHFGLSNMHFKLWIKSKRNQVGEALWESLSANPDFVCSLEAEPGSDYYEGFQLKSYAQFGENTFELADCGLVSWAAELKGNRHLNCLISGVGLERILILS